MASSRVMPSSSTANSVLACEPSMNSFTMSGDRARNMRSTSMDDLLRNIYGDGTAAVASLDTPFGGDAGDAAAPPPLSPAGSLSLPRSIGRKTVEGDLRREEGGWRRGGSGYKEATSVATAAYGEMTLEDFLARVEALREEDVRVLPGGLGVDAVMNDRFGQ